MSFFSHSFVSHMTQSLTDHNDESKDQRPNSWTQLGQKSFPPCYSQSSHRTDLTPPPLPTPHLARVVESGLQCIRKPQV
jgi:hypothetical protein